ncbi:FemAB family XrtA/PEP-CTERM system-associated protein [Stieleria varia]|uniref:FemAB family protein n=1 Tax=Stieleria varia TaxID=2528005 RepID=A0A5C6APY3_9BACT|nr:FemAB family XrtA/PEP-CTERM system-associated protein [Stieleria varia]TWU01289.1 FemAB family protein [Stieleria varia]
MNNLSVDVRELDGQSPTQVSGECDFPKLAAHHPAWAPAICRGLSHTGFVITVRDASDVVGVLTVVLVKGPIFGRFLVSLPYINTGGVWARDEQVASLLVDRACDLADKLDVKYLELRHEVPVEHPRLNFRKTEKVHMRLPLPATDEELDASFKSKLRSQVRKADQFDHSVAWGGKELLNEFYHVFAINMRDLGTPVFSRRLFASVLDGFEGDAELCVVRGDGQPQAAALLVHAGGVTEVPSASCLRSQNHTGANMWMYRHLLRRAIERGSTQFDFGRSSVGSGTYKFKAQWGAEPDPAVWQYYVRKGSVEAMRPDNAGNQRLIKIWQKLPVWLTRLMGPTIVRGIP